MSPKFLLFVSFAALLTTGCASYRPILDENAKFEKVGEAQAERDIDLCVAKADRYLERHKNERLKKDAGRGAVAGAAIGGALGLLSGQGLKGGVVGAGAGAAVGAGSAAGKHLAKDNLTPDELKQRYLTRCLGRKGYEVIGWK